MCILWDLYPSSHADLTTTAAAKAALRRKKVHEKNLEQTQAQIVQLEQQIYSIEAANINHETLAAMKAAGAAMEKIHNGMTVEQVDETMYVPYSIAGGIAELAC